MSLKPASTFILNRSPLVDANGNPTYATTKQLTLWDVKLNNGLDQIGNFIGNIDPAVQIVGKSGTVGTITQNLSPAGVVTGAGVDFALPYANKDTDHIADGTGSPLAGGKAAYLALVTSTPIANGLLEWDGAAWQWIQRPQTIAAVPSNWLRSFDQTTGAFTASQPTFTNISGTATAAQIGTGTPSAGKYVDGGTGAWTALPGGGVPVYQEQVGGTGTAWTLADTPVDVTEVQLFTRIAGFGGVVLFQGAGLDYTISGTAITTAISYTSGTVFAKYHK